jgi:hypothetical protein
MNVQEPIVTISHAIILPVLAVYQLEAEIVIWLWEFTGASA